MAKIFITITVGTDANGKHVQPLVDAFPSRQLAEAGSLEQTYRMKERGDSPDFGYVLERSVRNSVRGDIQRAIDSGSLGPLVRKQMRGRPSDVQALVAEFDPADPAVALMRLVNSARKNET